MSAGLRCSILHHPELRGRTDRRALAMDHTDHRKYHGIHPADGKLGVMIAGMGAVATTFVAGVETIRRGLAQPIGSLTQLGTIRLGKRTDVRPAGITRRAGTTSTS